VVEETDPAILISPITLNGNPLARRKNGDYFVTLFNLYSYVTSAATAFPDVTSYELTKAKANSYYYQNSNSKGRAATRTRITCFKIQFLKYNWPNSITSSTF